MCLILVSRHDPVNSGFLKNSSVTSAILRENVFLVSTKRIKLLIEEWNLGLIYRQSNGYKVTPDMEYLHLFQLINTVY